MYSLTVYILERAFGDFNFVSLCMALVNSGAWFQGLKPNGLQRDSGNQRIMTDIPTNIRAPSKL